VLALCAFPIQGQTADTGAIAGTVIDPRGALVPRAAVVINRAPEKSAVAVSTPSAFGVISASTANPHITQCAEGGILVCCVKFSGPQT